MPLRPRETTVTKVTSEGHGFVRFRRLAPESSFRTHLFEALQWGGEQVGANRMKVHYRLAAGAALGVIALTTAVPADAARAKRHAAARKHVDPRDAQIRALEAKVDALTARLD